MTYIPLPILEERRAAGLSPKGGPLPRAQEKELFDKDPLTMTTSERKAMVDRLLLAYWDHPMVSSLPFEILRYTGQSPEKTSPHDFHSPAEYIHDLKMSEAGLGENPPGRGRGAYNALMKLVEKFESFSAHE